MDKKIVIVGAGVAGVNAATKLVDNGYPGNLITIIDMGKSPYERQPSEVMEGFLGAGGWSDGKLTYHTAIGGQLSKYCGDEKAMELMDQVINNFKRFHPKPEEVQCSNPQEEPEFIKPYFGLRLFPVWHIGTDYLHEIGKNWYDFLVEKGVNFEWETKVETIDFHTQRVITDSKLRKVKTTFKGDKEKLRKDLEKYGIDMDSQIQSIQHYEEYGLSYDTLIFGVGKSGIDFGKQLAEQYELPTEPKSVQIGVRFEAPQKHFQKLIDISYDFKLYRKFEDEGVSLRSFCTNNNAAYVAVENTYGDVSYNGHAKKDEKYRNDMTNFGILMEIRGIDNPFEWSRKVVDNVNQTITIPMGETNNASNINIRTGMYYSPSNRESSKTSEGFNVETFVMSDIDTYEEFKTNMRDSFEGYSDYIFDFIEDMKKVFPTLGDDWGIYIPEVKYLSPEVVVDHGNLSLVNYPNIHFVGDALSARGITVSGAQGIYAAGSILKSTPQENFSDNIEF